MIGDKQRRIPTAIRRLLGILNDMPSMHPHVVWIKKYRKQTVIERYVFDRGTKALTLLDRAPRPDLNGQQEMVFPLFGNETPREIDTLIEAHTDSTNTDWFTKKERPDWAAITRMLQDADEHLADKSAGRFRIALPGRDF